MMIDDNDDDDDGGVVPHGRRFSLSDRGMAAMAESLLLSLFSLSSIASVVGGRVAVVVKDRVASLGCQDQRR